MSRMRRPRTNSLHFLILLALLATAPGVVFAQVASIGMPENSHARSYGGGWECDRGYQAVDEACVAVKVPANAYPTNMSYGRGWECDHGFREVSGICTAVEVPSNAYLDPSGDRWQCDRGYRETDEACVGINVPANGYLVNSTYGRGWNCDRGCRRGVRGRECAGEWLFCGLFVWIGVEMRTRVSSGRRGLHRFETAGERSHQLFRERLGL
jgi:hypothetical protein